MYPTFSDVARNIRIILDTSEYDAENKGAYKGSLLTRLQSLTNGINGTIFVTDELEAEALFEQNVNVRNNGIQRLRTIEIIGLLQMYGSGDILIIVLVMPKAIYIPHIQKPTVAIPCNYKFDPEHGLAIIFENGKFEKVDLEDAIL